MATEADFRLPRSVVPSHYDLRLVPDLEGARFTGSVSVTVEVREAVDEIVLNAVELAITSAVLRDAAGTRFEPSAVLDAETERATLRLGGTAVPGPATLELGFAGILNDQLRGFYRSTYTDDEGTNRTIATTQFEPTDARRAFPCWDEPDLKATFDVILVVDGDLLAVSNAPEIGREPAEGGKVAVRFATTPRMSTYLLAFVVGRLEATEPVDVDGVPLRIVHVPGKGHLTEFALEMGAFALRYYADYYGIPYPGAKLDQIAIPDFAWGAMENLGAVTYRESVLLVDREKATQAELRRVADVIAHEIAHMWFGDLVTMRWWNGIWLNEAFATFAEMKCVDAYRPRWRRWLAFAAARDHSMETDATGATRPIEFPVASPEDANAMFDVLTYEKGSAVLRMLERYLGEETFRRGISRYLRRHAHGNTDTADLWTALEEVSGEPVGEIMEGWIFRGGFPLVEVVVDGDGLLLRQRRFRYLDADGGRWQVPVLYRVGDQERRLLLADEEVALPAPPATVVNAGGDGFYRVRYRGFDPGERIGGLAPEERYMAISDRWAFVLAAMEEAAGFLDLVRPLGDEAEPDVWEAILAGIGELDRIAPPGPRERLRRFVRELVGPRVSELGWEPGSGEDEKRRRLRGLLLGALGDLGEDVATIERARDVAAAGRRDRGAVDPEVYAAAVTIAARHGTGEDFDRYVEIFRGETDPQERVRYLRAAALVPQEATARRLVDMCLDGTVRTQDAFWVLAVLLGQRETGAAVWWELRRRWDELLATIPPTIVRRVIDTIPARSEPEVAADIEAWLADHPLPGAELYQAQQVELMRVRVRLRQREAHRFAAAL